VYATVFFSLNCQI